MFWTMVATYRDGYHVTDIDKATYTVNRMFYPRWWLQAVGFFQHHGVAGGIMFEPAPSGADVVATQGTIGTFSLFVFVAVAMFAAGYYFSNKINGVYHGKSRSSTSSYQYVEVA